MKVRAGFVTNSSSTNFLIISKEELTQEYLMEKLGLSKESRIKYPGQNLANNLIDGASRGVRWFDIKVVNVESIEKVFGQDSAKKFEELSRADYHTYLGYTQADDDYLTSFLTTDSFIIDEEDFYMNGKNCVW